MKQPQKGAKGAREFEQEKETFVSTRLVLTENGLELN